MVVHISQYKEIESVRQAEYKKRAEVDFLVLSLKIDEKLLKNGWWQIQKGEIDDYLYDIIRQEYVLAGWTVRICDAGGGGHLIEISPR